MRHRTLALAVFASTWACTIPAFARQVDVYTNPFDSAGNVAGWQLDGDPSSFAVDADPGPSHANDNCLTLKYLAGFAGDPWGQATSSVVIIDQLSQPTVTFWCRYELRSSSYGASDYRELYLYSIASASSALFTLGDAGADLDCGAMKQWHQHTIPVPFEVAVAGSFQVLFNYSSSGLYTGPDLEGWMVDELRVSGLATPPPGPGAPPLSGPGGSTPLDLDAAEDDAILPCSAGVHASPGAMLGLAGLAILLIRAGRPIR